MNEPVIKQLGVYDKNSNSWTKVDIGIKEADADIIKLNKNVLGQDNVQAALSTAFGTSPLTADRIVMTNNLGHLTTANVKGNELIKLQGLTTNIQNKFDQIDGELEKKAISQWTNEDGGGITEQSSSAMIYRHADWTSSSRKYIGWQIKNNNTNKIIKQQYYYNPDHSNSLTQQFNNIDDNYTLKRIFQYPTTGYDYTPSHKMTIQGNFNGNDFNVTLFGQQYIQTSSNIYYTNDLFTDYNTATNSPDHPRFCKSGSVVMFSGAFKNLEKITPSSATASVEIGQIVNPVFCPLYTISSVQQGSSTSRWMMSITANGQISVARYGTDGIIPANSWLKFYVMYLSRYPQGK